MAVLEKVEGCVFPLFLSLTYSRGVWLGAACVFGSFNSDASNAMLFNQSRQIRLECIILDYNGLEHNRLQHNVIT